MRTIIASFALALVAAPLAAQGGAYAQGGAAPASAAAAAPTVGSMAPDFTASVVDAKGVKSAPVALSKLRGKVVVLAFYPGDATPGCTIEMTKFRDEYKTLFGDGVVVLPTSVQGVDSHTKWEVSMKFPFDLMLDTAGVVAKQYGSYGPRMFSRTLWVIGKDGKIVYADTKFNVNSEDAYNNMSAAIKAAKDAK
jgi:peroxiredoxin Q/BCP